MERNEKNPSTNPTGNPTPVDPNETPQQREERVKRERTEQGDNENQADQPRREGNQEGDKTNG